MRCFVSAALLALASLCSGQLADSVWPCATGPRTDNVVPLLFSPSMAGAVILQAVVAYGEYLTDEEGNYYAQDSVGLAKFDSSFNLLWHQPQARQPFLIQDDGSVIAYGPPNSNQVVLVDPSGSVEKIVPLPPGQVPLTAIQDGGLFTSVGAGCTRFYPDLTVRYTANFYPFTDSAGRTWSPYQEGNKSYIAQYDDDGIQVGLVDITSYGQGLGGGTLEAVGDGTIFYLITGGDSRSMPVAVDSSGMLLWVQDDGPNSYCLEVMPSPTGDTYYLTEVISDSGYATYTIFHRDPTGLRTKIASTINWPTWDLYGNFHLVGADAAGNLLYRSYWASPTGSGGWSSSDGYGMYSGAGVGLWSVGSDSNSTFEWHNYLEGWGFHQDGFVTHANSYGAPDQASGDETDVAGPTGVIRSTADLDVRAGAVNPLTYRFRLMPAGSDRPIKRRGHSTGPFTWEFHSSPGTFEVLASADYTLWQKQTVTVATSPVDLTFALTVGDLNGDNIIDLLDLSDWLASRVDLNNDGHAGIMDLSLILLNFGLIGDS